MAHQLSRVCLNPKPLAKLAGLSTVALKHSPPFFRVCLKLTWQFSLTTTSQAPANLVLVAVIQPRAEGICWIRKVREHGITHFCLVTVAKGKMPSLPSWQSNKLSIMGRGFRVNSMLLLFSTLDFDEKWLRSSRVPGHRLSLS